MGKKFFVSYENYFFNDSSNSEVQKNTVALINALFLKGDMDKKKVIRIAKSSAAQWGASSGPISCNCLSSLVRDDCLSLHSFKKLCGHVGVKCGDDLGG